MSERASEEELSEALDDLISCSMIFRVGEFFSLHNNPMLVDRRARGNRRAAAMIQQAEKPAAIISSFPFVRAVALSGSLSKNFADESSDTDFFIITAPNRLWIARTLLHIFKKFTYLSQRQEHYCMNYFIDETQMTIVEKNMYTAIEAATILPMRGISLFEQFHAANTWAKTFLPNNHLRVAPQAELQTNWWTKSIEKLLDNKMGNMIDNALRRLTEKSWNAKTRKNRQTTKGFVMRLHTSKHFAKPHPENFQQTLLERYAQSVTELMERYAVAALDPARPLEKGAK